MNSQGQRLTTPEEGNAARLGIIQLLFLLDHARVVELHGVAGALYLEMRAEEARLDREFDAEEVGACLQG